MRKTKQKHLGRLSALTLVLAGVLFVYAFANTGGGPVALRAEHMLAAATVSMSAAIPPNPYNSLAEQLDTKAATLSQREAAVSAREAQGGLGSILGILSFIASIILFILVGANFYFDARRQKIAPSSFIVDVRNR